MNELQASQPSAKPKEEKQTEPLLPEEQEPQPEPYIPQYIPLSDNDCSKCHEKPVEDIDRKGMAHKTRITCTDCHKGHPPSKWGIIPKCSDCHTDKPHFELGACIECHVNPHTPLEIKLTKTVTKACVTCHTEQYDQLQTFSSFHSSLACTACHNFHGQIPSCSQCHRPHSDAMTEKDCGLCHQAHKPLNVTYGAETPSESCGVCHLEAFEMLATTPTKHRRLLCTTCHIEKHKNIPQCQGCHGDPHPEALHQKFPVCGACHGIAHDLSQTNIGHRRAREPRSGDVQETH